MNYYYRRLGVRVLAQNVLERRTTEIRWNKFAKDQKLSLGSIGWLDG